MNVVLAEAVLIPPEKHTRHQGADDQRSALDQACEEFSAAELDDAFVAELKDRPVLDNHNADRIVGQVLAASLAPGKLVEVTLALNADTNIGREAIRKLRSGEYTGVSAFHRFRVCRDAEGNLVTTKSHIAEVSVCATGRRPGTYITRVANRTIALDQAEETVVAIGDVFASANVGIATVPTTTASSVDKSDTSSAPTSAIAEYCRVCAMSEGVVTPNPSEQAQPSPPACEANTHVPDPINAPIGGENATVPAPQTTAPPADADATALSADPSEPAAMPSMQDTLALLQQSMQSLESERLQRHNLEEQLRERNEQDAIKHREAEEAKQIAEQTRIQNERSAMQSSFKEMGLPSVDVDALSDINDTSVAALSAWAKEAANLHRKNQAERNRNEQTLRDFQDIKRRLGPAIITTSAPAPAPAPQPAPSSVPAEPITHPTQMHHQSALREKRDTPDTPSLDRSASRDLTRPLPGETRAETAARLKNALEQGKMSFGEWKDVMEDVVQRDSIPSSLQIVGSVAASESGGSTYCREFDIIAQKNNPYAAPANTPQLIGPSWKDWNPTLHYDIQNNMRSMNKQKTTHLSR